jgi:hypothetical protein
MNLDPISQIPQLYSILNNNGTLDHCNFDSCRLYVALCIFCVERNPGSLVDLLPGTLFLHPNILEVFNGQLSTKLIYLDLKSKVNLTASHLPGGYCNLRLVSSLILPFHSIIDLWICYILGHRFNAWVPVMNAANHLAVVLLPRSVPFHSHHFTSGIIQYTFTLLHCVLYRTLSLVIA